MNGRYPNLQDVLIRFSKAVADAKGRSALAAGEPFLFSALCRVWLTPADLSNPPPLAKLGVEVGLGPEIISTLQRIFDKDTHLAMCAGSIANLAVFFDRYFIARAVELIRAGTSQPEPLVEQFLTFAYETGSFANVILSHLFNFQMEHEELRCGDVRIVRLPGVTNMLSAGQKVGDCMIVTEIDKPAPPSEIHQWLRDKNLSASSFARLLQYFKGGVVHIDYLYRQFRPDWANLIRFGEHVITGLPRWSAYEGGAQPYTLSQEERSRLERWWTVYTSPAVVARFADLRQTLRQATFRAGSYYEASHERSDTVERFIALAVALESLFSPPYEVNFGIRQRTAQLIGRTAMERKEIFAKTGAFLKET